MGDTSHAQAINLFARTVDPDGHRTIGVLTKPDLIPEGTHSTWMAVASNRDPKQPPSRLGCYVVKNPGQKELQDGISFGAARMLEAEYFSNDVHWSSAGEDLAGRLGINHFRSALSNVLVEEMKANIPDMRQNASMKLQVVPEE